MTTMESLMKEALLAPEERKAEAIRVLRGEVTKAAGKSATPGPLLLGMLAGAKFLGVSRATLWRMIKAGTIVKVEVFPGSYWLKRKDLEALGATRHAKADAGATNEEP